MAMDNRANLELYKIAFDETGYLNAVKEIISMCLDTLSVRMQEVMKQAIEGCSESSGVMKGATTAHVRELSRSLSDTSVEIEVGVDPGEANGEQDYIRVMVTLFGNGEVWARANGAGWTKHVGGLHQNHALIDYRIAQFEQGDHSDAMLEQFYQIIQKDAEDFLEVVAALIAGIDISQYLIIT